MNYKPILAIVVGALFLGGMFVFFPRGKMKKNDPLGMSESKSSEVSKSAKVDKPIIVKQGELSE